MEEQCRRLVVEAASVLEAAIDRSFAEPAPPGCGIDYWMVKPAVPGAVPGMFTEADTPAVVPAKEPS